MNQKPKKIKDPAESFLTGVGLAIGFTSAAIFLIFNNSYFANSTATTVVAVIFFILGAVGLNTEIEKYTNKKVSFNLGDLVGGILFLSIWYFLQFSSHHWAFNILYILLLIFGVTFVARWVISIGRKIVSGFEVKSVSIRIKVITLTIAQLGAVTAALVAILKDLKGIF